MRLQLLKSHFSAAHWQVAPISCFLLFTKPSALKINFEGAGDLSSYGAVAYSISFVSY